MLKFLAFMLALVVVGQLAACTVTPQQQARNDQALALY
jgi:outer membrane biogenesis lipoprotein LolB